jgi:predicted ATPase
LAVVLAFATVSPVACVGDRPPDAPFPAFLAMIASFHIANFKSYRDARLSLAPLTVFVGANASGKSNAIEAIRLLSLIAQGRRLDDVISEIQSSDDVIRGSSRDLPHTPGAPVILGCELEASDWNRLELAIRIEQEGAAVHDEAISATSGSELYRLSTASTLKGDARLVFRAPRLADPWSIVVSRREAVFPRLESLAADRPDLPVESLVRRVGADFRSHLERIVFFDPQPRRMRGYSFSGERVLKEDGSNLSSVLLDLCSTRAGVDAVLGFVADLPEQPFVDIHFIRTERDDVMVRLHESFGMREEVRDAPVLSDGTLRVLGIAAALLSAERESTVVIEEVDSGIHPSRAKSLLQNIERVANERRLHVVLTTHNPALLDGLSDDAIPHVVCCYRDSREGDSRLLRLEELRSYPELVARGPLGQLMTRGVLDYFLKHQRSDAEQRQNDEAWLHALKVQVEDA